MLPIITRLYNTSPETVSNTFRDLAETLNTPTIRIDNRGLTKSLTLKQLRDRDETAGRTDYFPMAIADDLLTDPRSRLRDIGRNVNHAAHDNFDLIGGNPDLRAPKTRALLIQRGACATGGHGRVNRVLDDLVLATDDRPAATGTFLGYIRMTDADFQNNGSWEKAAEQIFGKGLKLIDAAVVDVDIAVRSLIVAVIAEVPLDNIIVENHQGY